MLHNKPTEKMWNEIILKYKPQYKNGKRDVRPGNWIQIARNRIQYRTLVNAAMNFLAAVTYKMRKYPLPA
jgi:hypothetical protein